MQLLPSLLAGLKAICTTFPDGRKGRGGNIEIADFGLAAFSMFFMQSASFLAYQRGLEKGQGRSNGQTLFGIGRIPSDNYIRNMLDEADPALLQPCFERMETLLAEPAMRQAFGRLGGRTLIAWDGTQYFCSQKLGCPNCLTRERSNGKKEGLLEIEWVILGVKVVGLLEIEWVILGVKVVKGPVDIGFWRLGPTRRSGIMRDGEIGQGTASAVGWIFVRGLSGARDRSWGIW